MKKLVPFLALTLLLTGCAKNLVNPDQETMALKKGLIVSPNSEVPETYHEIETDLTQSMLEEGSLYEVLNDQIEKLKKEGKIFWHDSNKLLISREAMPALHTDFECKDGIKSYETCSITGLFGSPKDLKDFKLGKCLDEYSCSIIDAVSLDFLNKLKSPQFFVQGKDIFSVDSPEIVGDYTIYKNQEPFFSYPMYGGTEGAVTEAVSVLNFPAFNFLEKMKTGEGNKIMATSNILYKGEALNEKYDLQGSSHLFSFKDKLGLVGEKEGKRFLYFNGQKISEDFDQIVTHACCMAFEYPIQIDENGILFFMAKRGENFYFVEVNLNKYL